MSRLGPGPRVGVGVTSGGVFSVGSCLLETGAVPYKIADSPLIEPVAIALIMNCR